jgi:hypothetical protein
LLLLYKRNPVSKGLAKQVLCKPAFMQNKFYAICGAELPSPYPTTRLLVMLGFSGG